MIESSWQWFHPNSWDIIGQGVYYLTQLSALWGESESLNLSEVAFTTMLRIFHTKIDPIATINMQSYVPHKDKPSMSG